MKKRTCERVLIVYKGYKFNLLIDCKCKIKFSGCLCGEHGDYDFEGSTMLFDMLDKHIRDYENDNLDELWSPYIIKV